MNNLKKYKWDLTTIYKDISEYKKDLENLKKLHEEMISFKGKIMESGKSLYEYYELNSKFGIIAGKLTSYAHLNFDLDTSVTKYQEMLLELDSIFNKFNIETSFILEEIFKYDYSKIQEYIKEEPRLKKYERTLKKLYRFYDHHLNENDEKIVNMLSHGYRQEETYSYLLDTDMKFGYIIDENNKRVELTESNYSKFLESNNQKMRAKAFKKLYNTIGSFKNTFASLYQSQIISNNTIAKLYKFNSSFENSIYNDELTQDIYIDLIEVVNKNLSKLHEYYHLRKELLNLDKLHIYDTYVPLINTDNKEYSYDDAVLIIKEALKVMGKEYLDVVDKILDSNCIDVYHQKGKRSGAYSGGSYATNPFILLNYENKLDDVSTLIHEMGHSVHSYFSRNNNEYQDSCYRIYVAEIASTVNELLLAHYLLKNADKDNQKIIYNRLLDLYKGTIFRQTMFAEFEYKMYNDSLNNIPLSEEYISNSYYELVKKYFGNDVVIDNLIRYEWARIPHFYMGFYVYKYATGISYAIYITNKILSGDKLYLDHYINFLKSGDKKSVLELLSEIDLNDTKKVINEAMNEFSNTLEKFKKLVK